MTLGPVHCPNFFFEFQGPVPGDHSLASVFPWGKTPFGGEGVSFFFYFVAAGTGQIFEVVVFFYMGCMHAGLPESYNGHKYSTSLPAGAGFEHEVDCSLDTTV